MRRSLNCIERHLCQTGRNKMDVAIHFFCHKTNAVRSFGSTIGIQTLSQSETVINTTDRQNYCLSETCECSPDVGHQYGLLAEQIK